MNSSDLGAVETLVSTLLGVDPREDVCLLLDTVSNVREATFYGTLNLVWAKVNELYKDMAPGTAIGFDAGHEAALDSVLSTISSLALQQQPGREG